MENNIKKPVDHSNKFTLKVIIIAILFVSAIVALAVYIYSYPRATIRLYNDEGVLEETVKKYKGSKLRLQDLPEIYKTGHSFTYWSYDANGYDEVMDNTPLDQDEYDFYGHFERNTYTVTYYIQKYTNDAETDIEYQEYTKTEVLYADEFVVPTGIDESTGKLTALLADRVGYTFNGWSTSVEYEDAIANNESIRVFKGGETYSYQDSENLQLYAIWSKDVYSIKLNTGVTYKTYSAVEIGELILNRDYIIYDNGGINMYFAIDRNGDYVIQNDTVDNRTENGINTASVKYLDYFQLAISRFDEYTLPADIIVGASEYDFKGWYLTNTFEDNMTTNQTLQVEVDPATRIPYLKGAGGKKIVNAVEVAPVNGVKQYVFNIYSKWVRRSYTVTLKDTKKVLTTDSGIPYKVYKYDDNYGKLYNTDINFVPLMNNYLGKDEEGNDIVGATKILGDDYRADVTVMNLTTPYKFVGWTEQETLAKYYNWTQVIEADTTTGLPIAYNTVYDNATYRHETSGDVLMYANWSQMYEICYAKKYTQINSRYASSVYAIIGEVVDLFSSDYMMSLGGKASTVVSIADNLEHLGWTSYSNCREVSKKQYDTPTLFTEVGHCFYQLTQADLRNQTDITATNNFFVFLNYTEEITNE